MNYVRRCVFQPSPTAKRDENMFQLLQVLLRLIKGLMFSGVMYYNIASNVLVVEYVAHLSN